MLKLIEKRLYKVKKGQTIKSLSAELSTTPYAIIAQNGLTAELFEGQLINLPRPTDVYTVQAGDTKELLCGGGDAYREKNGTDVFYLGQRVCL